MRLLFAGVLLATGLAAQPASATEWLVCGDAEGSAQVSLLLGALDVMAIVGITLSEGQSEWSSQPAYGDGTPIAVGQAFADDQMILVDLVDENISTIIASLRVFKAETPDDLVYGGVLKIGEDVAVPVACSY